MMIDGVARPVRFATHWSIDRPADQGRDRPCHWLDGPDRPVAARHAATRAARRGGLRATTADGPAQHPCRPGRVPGPRSRVSPRAAMSSTGSGCRARCRRAPLWPWPFFCGRTAPIWATRRHSSRPSIPLAMRTMFARAGEAERCQRQGIAWLSGLAEKPTACGDMDKMLAGHPDKDALIGNLKEPMRGGSRPTACTRGPTGSS